MESGYELIDEPVRSLYDIAAALGLAVNYFFPDQSNHQNVDEKPTSASTEELTASQMRSAHLNGQIVATAECTRPISASPIVHSDSRRTIQLNGGDNWSRLTALAEKEAERLEITYAPGAMSGVDLSHHGR